MELTDKPPLHWFSAEMLVAYQFCKAGYIIGVPLSPCGYDLLVDTGERIARVQVKRAAFYKQRERKAGLGDRDHWQVSLWLNHKRRISDRAFDYLAAVCDETAIYVIPVDKLKSEQDGVLLRVFHIKPALENGRADSMKAGQRWEPYKNKFDLTSM